MSADFELVNNDDAQQKIMGVIKTDEVKYAQFIHASLIIFVPTIAFIFFLFLVPTWGLSTANIILFILFYYLTMVAGITVGYHRLFAHRAFATHPWMRAVFAILGCMAAQGSPAYWVSNHRRHHKYSDKTGDPHSPYIDDRKTFSAWRGFLHSHFGWMYTHDLTSTARYAKDILQDKNVMWVGRYYVLWVYLGILLPPLIIWLYGGSIHECIIAFLFAGLTRLFFTFHSTSSVNSICHMFGQTDYDTREMSKNNFSLSLPTGGESWHNNHHAFPYSAKFGLRWWQVDLGYITIFLLKKIGLVWSVKLPKNKVQLER